MGDDETQTRPHTINVRVSDGLKRVARQQAGGRDMDLSEYIRTLIREDRDDNPPEELIIEDH